MRWSFTLVALAVEALVVTAQLGTSAANPAATQASPDPCAVISSRAVSYLSASPKATAAALKPSEVHACFQSVPYDQGKGIKQVAWIQDIFQLQSTLAYLKAPPPGYPFPAVDLLGGLTNISATIASGNYTNEYDIELDLYNLLNSAHDAHLVYTPFLPGLFTYRRGFSLVSVSLDGIQVPNVYFFSDIKGLSNANFTPSAVTSINGQDVKSIMQFGQGMQDLDALYNSVFQSPANAAFPNGTGSFGVSRFTHHGDTTSCTFENGTSTVVSAVAEIGASLATAIPASGQNFFKLLTAAGANSSSTSSSASPTSSSTPSSLPSPLPLGPNYPPPSVKSYQNYVSGSFLNGTENSDVAVLSIASFNLTGSADLIEFLQVSSKFLAECASARKRRLIVDVRNNPGGMVTAGYALFQQLFPSVGPYSGFRMRASDAANALGQIASTSPQSDDPSDLTNSVFNAQTVLQRPDGPNFDSWQQLYGPLRQHGDLFSNVGAWDYLNSSDIAAEVSNTTVVPPQVFASEDITLLTDGQCSSTCTDFANLMINQGRVKTVTVGGRPNNQPMAVIGGVQGAQVLELPVVQSFARQAIALQVNATGNSSAQTYETRRLLQSLASPPPIAPLFGAASVSVNLLDNIAQNDTSMTPLQFSGGIAADCRFYYMPADITNVANTWARVAKGVKAGGRGLCINGTLSHSTRNGGAPLTSKGGASAVEAARLWWILLSVALGSVATVLL